MAGGKKLLLANGEAVVSASGSDAAAAENPRRAAAMTCEPNERRFLEFNPQQHLEEPRLVLYFYGPCVCRNHTTKRRKFLSYSQCREPNGEQKTVLVLP